MPAIPARPQKCGIETWMLVFDAAKSKWIDLPHPCGSPFGPSASPMFATASAFAVGFRSQWSRERSRNNDIHWIAASPQ